MYHDDDPGWPARLDMFLVVLPGGLQWYMRRHARDDALVSLRAVTLAFTGFLVLFGVVLAFIGERHGSVEPYLLLLAGVAILSILAIRVVERPLQCDSDTTLAFSYRTRYFMRVAFTQAVSLFAFTFAFVGAPFWMYYVGAAFSVVHMWTRAAPTRAALEREQQRLRDAGCRRLLVRALRTAGREPR